MKSHIQRLLIALAFLAGIHQATAQGTTAFTYQGQLRDNGTNANGTYTMIFNLYDSPSGGNLIGGPITTTATLANGLFTVNLDFGAGAFNGSARYLDITVQSGSDSEELSPRVQVLPEPYAIFANVANTASNLLGTLPANQLTNTLLSAQLDGTYSNSLAFNNTNNDFYGTFNGDGSQLVNLDASFLASGTMPGSRLAGSYPNTVTFDNTGNSFFGLFVGTFYGNGSALSNVDACMLDGLTSSNFATLDSNQTFSGTNEFDQGISIGDWDIGAGEDDGFSDLLTFSQGGSVQFALAPLGAENGQGQQIGGIIFGSTEIDGGNLNVDFDDGNAFEVLDGEVNVYDGSLFVGYGNGAEAGVYLNADGDASVSGDLTVGGTIYENDGDSIAAKATVTSTGSRDILNSVARLNIFSWNSKPNAKHAATCHIGPRAHDFNTAFGFGNSTNSISLVDETGVALAAIQGLNQKLNERDAEIKALEKRLADLEALVKSQNNKPTGGAK